MNFLAHLWLAEHSATSLAGSILGDVARGADLSAYPPALAQGIRLHRRIDAVTDRHPAVVAARERFAPGARRYAGIVLDVACDHLLARDWPAFSSEPLEAFCRRAGAAVAAERRWFEQAGGRGSQAGAFAQLLLSYRHADGIEQALQRISRRLRNPQAFAAASDDWPQHAALLAADFPALLQSLLAELRATLTAASRPAPGAPSAESRPHTARA